MSSETEQHAWTFTCLAFESRTRENTFPGDHFHLPDGLTLHVCQDQPSRSDGQPDTVFVQLEAATPSEVEEMAARIRGSLQAVQAVCPWGMDIHFASPQLHLVAPRCTAQLLPGTWNPYDHRVAVAFLTAGGEGVCVIDQRDASWVFDYTPCYAEGATTTAG